MDDLVRFAKIVHPALRPPPTEIFLLTPYLGHTEFCCCGAAILKNNVYRAANQKCTVCRSPTPKASQLSKLFLLHGVWETQQRRQFGLKNDVNLYQTVKNKDKRSDVTFCISSFCRRARCVKILFQFEDHVKRYICLYVKYADCDVPLFPAIPQCSKKIADAITISGLAHSHRSPTFFTFPIPPSVCREKKRSLIL